MLVLLEEVDLESYLKPFPVGKGETIDPAEEQLFQSEILNVCRPIESEKIAYHTVLNIKNRKESPYIGNVPEIAMPYEWEFMDYEQFPEIAMELD